MIKDGSCINPETALVSGTKIFHEKLAHFSAFFQAEFSDQAITMFYSYKIFDTQDPVKPIKTRVAQQLLKKNTGYQFELTLHKLELSDDIYSPFKSSQNRSYLTL